MIIGCDIDGILSNFFTAYEDLVIKISGEDKFPGRYPEVEPPCWFWTAHYGYAPEVDAAAWDHIKNSQSFWLGLGLLPQAKEFMFHLSKASSSGKHVVYFVTDRPGLNTQTQTMQWLVRNGYYTLPSVIISKNKGDVCKALGIDVYIDDRPTNVQDVWNKAPDTKMYLFKYPYNSELHGIKPEFEVDSLLEFAQKAKLWENSQQTYLTNPAATVESVI